MVGERDWVSPFSGHIFTICPLPTTLFLNLKDFKFFTFELAGKESGAGTIYEQMAKPKKADNSGENDLENVKYILKNGVVKLNGIDFDVEKYLTESSDIMECLCVIGEVVKITFKLFSCKNIKMTIDEIMTLYDFSKTYNKPPIECFFEKKEYNEWDAFSFNMFIYSNAKIKEFEAQKMAQRKR